jgi:hypothetical protein
MTGMRNARWGTGVIVLALAGPCSGCGIRLTSETGADAGVDAMKETFIVLSVWAAVTMPLEDVVELSVTAEGPVSTKMKTFTIPEGSRISYTRAHFGIQLTPAEAGTFTVTIDGRNATGCTRATRTVVVEVRPGEQPQVDVELQLVSCSS